MAAMQPVNATASAPLAVAVVVSAEEGQDVSSSVSDNTISSQRPGSTTVKLS